MKAHKKEKDKQQRFVQKYAKVVRRWLKNHGQAVSAKIIYYF